MLADRQRRYRGTCGCFGATETLRHPAAQPPPPGQRAVSWDQSRTAHGWDKRQLDHVVYGRVLRMYRRTAQQKSNSHNILPLCNVASMGGAATRWTVSGAPQLHRHSTRESAISGVTRGFQQPFFAPSPSGGFRVASMIYAVPDRKSVV